MGNLQTIPPVALISKNPYRQSLIGEYLPLAETKWAVFIKNNGNVSLNSGKYILISDLEVEKMKYELKPKTLEK